MSQQFQRSGIGCQRRRGSSHDRILEERAFPVATLYPLASSRSAGDTVRFGGKNVDILDVEAFDWSQVEIALFSAGAGSRPNGRRSPPSTAASSSTTPPASATTRHSLVIPEVNPDALADFRNRNIIANPNCSCPDAGGAQTLHDEVGIVRINVATYQSVSGSGKEG